MDITAANLVFQFLLVCFLVSVTTGYLGSYVAKQKGRSENEGFWLGFLFSMPGVIVAALLPDGK